MLGKFALPNGFWLSREANESPYEIDNNYQLAGENPQSLYSASELSTNRGARSRYRCGEASNYQPSKGDDSRKVPIQFIYTTENNRTQRIATISYGDAYCLRFDKRAVSYIEQYKELYQDKPGGLTDDLASL